MLEGYESCKRAWGHGVDYDQSVYFKKLPKFFSLLFEDDGLVDRSCNDIERLFCPITPLPMRSILFLVLVNGSIYVHFIDLIVETGISP